MGSLTVPYNGEPLEEFVRNRLFDPIYEPKHKLVELYVKARGRSGNGVAYAAVQFEDEVYADVILLEKSGDEITYKTMSEYEGPCYYDAPKSLLNKLTPTSDRYASKWREKCLTKKRGAK